MSGARKAAHVIGAEIVPEAIENARRNAERNSIKNAEFLCADAGAAAAELARRGVRPDCIVADPPRKGMSPEAIDAMVSMQPPRIVYVSCDPGTLARDVKLLTQHGYTLTQAFGLSSLWKIWICPSSKMEQPIRRSRSMFWSIPG